MDEYFYNDDIDMNPTDEDYSLVDGDSTSEDNSVQRHLHEWVVNTGDNSGTPGETPQIPVSPSPPEEIIYVDFPIKQRFVINNYDQTYLKKLHDDGGLFYVIYEDGTEEQCEYTEVINPSAAEYFSINFEVDEITKANNQHFWYDDNGAHVTDETRYSWETNAAYNFSDLSDDNDHNNLLMNSYGLVIRRALKNLAAFSKSAVTFYDGDGNEASNILAYFGENGAQIGGLYKPRILLNANQFAYYSEYDIKLFNLNITEDVDFIEYAASNEEHESNTTSTIFLDRLAFVSTNAIYNTMRIWPPYNDSVIRMTIYLLDEENTEKYITLYYGVPTDEWTTWEYGSFRYNGENVVELFTTKRIFIRISFLKNVRVPNFSFGDCVSNSHYSFAEGHLTRSTGKHAHAEGYKTDASGINSHAEGYLSVASGQCSHAEGDSCLSSGYYAHSEGYFSGASGQYSHAEGHQTKAIGSNSHAEGYMSIVSANCAHAEGYRTEASGQYSHAEGHSSLSSGDYSHAEGYFSSASGQYSHAEGHSTISSGDYAHVEGYRTEASGQYSHAQNIGTIAQESYQSVIGKYNKVVNNAAFIVGNGTSENARSNAFIVDWDGNVNSSSFGIMDSAGNCLGKLRHVSNNEILELQLIFNDLEHPNFTNGIIIRKNSTISTIRNLVYNANSGDLVIPGTIWNSDGGLKINVGNIARNGAYPASTIVGQSPISFKDTNGEELGFINPQRYSDGRQSLQLTCVNETLSGSEVFNNIAMFVDKNNNSTYYVTNAGNFRAAIGAVASSDGRLKTDVQELDDDDVVKFIEMLKPSVYTINGERQVGLIAQDVAKADKWDTNMAFETREGIDGLDDWERMADGSPTWKLDYIRLLPPIIKALQKSIREVDSLKSRIYNLEQNIVK